MSTRTIEAHGITIAVPDAKDCPSCSSVSALLDVLLDKERTLEAENERLRALEKALVDWGRAMQRRKEASATLSMFSANPVVANIAYGDACEEAEATRVRVRDIALALSKGTS